MAAGAVGSSAHQRMLQRRCEEEIRLLEETNKALLARLSRQQEHQDEGATRVRQTHADAMGKLEADLAALSKAKERELADAHVQLDDLQRTLAEALQREAMALGRVEELSNSLASANGRVAASPPPAFVATRGDALSPTMMARDMDAFFSDVAEHADRDVLSILIAVEEDREKKDAELVLLRREMMALSGEAGSDAGGVGATTRPGGVEEIIKTCLDESHKQHESLLPVLVRLADDRQKLIDELAALRGTASTPEKPAAEALPPGPQSASPITVVRVGSPSPQWSSPAGSRRRVAFQATMLDKINGKLVERLEALETEHETTQEALTAKTAELAEVRQLVMAEAATERSERAEVGNGSIGSLAGTRRSMGSPSHLGSSMRSTGSAKDLTRAGMKRTIEELEGACRALEQELAVVRAEKVTRADDQLVADLKHALEREVATVRARDALSDTLERERTRYGLALQDIRNERDREVRDLRGKLDAALLDADAGEGKKHKPRRDRAGAVEERLTAARRVFDEQRAHDVALHSRKLQQAMQEKDNHIAHLRGQLKERGAHHSKVGEPSSPGLTVTGVDGDSSVTRIRQIHESFAARDAELAQLKHELRMERERVKDLRSVILHRDRQVGASSGSTDTGRSDSDAKWKGRFEDMRSAKDEEIQQLRALVARTEDREGQGVEALQSAHHQERDETVVAFTTQLEGLRDRKQGELEAVLSKLEESEAVVNALQGDLRAAESNAEHAMRRTIEHHEATRAKDVAYYNAKMEAVVCDLTAEHRALQEQVVAAMERCRAEKTQREEERERHARELVDVTTRAADDMARSEQRLAQRDVELSALRAAMSSLEGGVPTGATAPNLAPADATSPATVLEEIQTLTRLVEQKDDRIAELVREGADAKRREADASSALASATTAFEGAQDEAARSHSERLGKLADAVAARDLELAQAKAALAGSSASQLREQLVTLEATIRELTQRATAAETERDALIAERERAMVTDVALATLRSENAGLEARCRTLAAQGAARRPSVDEDTQSRVSPVNQELRVRLEECEKEKEMYHSKADALEEQMQQLQLQDVVQSARLQSAPDTSRGSGEGACAQALEAELAKVREELQRVSAAARSADDLAKDLQVAREDIMRLKALLASSTEELRVLRDTAASNGDADHLQLQVARLQAALEAALKTQQEKEDVIVELESLLQGVADANEARGQGAPEERIAALQADVAAKDARVAELGKDVVDVNARLAVSMARVLQLEADLAAASTTAGEGPAEDWKNKAFQYERNWHEAQEMLSLMEAARTRAEDDLTQSQREGSGQRRQLEALEARHRATLTELRKVESGSPRGSPRSAPTMSRLKRPPLSFTNSGDVESAAAEATAVGDRASSAVFLEPHASVQHAPAQPPVADDSDGAPSSRRSSGVLQPMISDAHSTVSQGTPSHHTTPVSATLRPVSSPGHLPVARTPATPGAGSMYSFDRVDSRGASGSTTTLHSPSDGRRDRDMDAPKQVNDAPMCTGASAATLPVPPREMRGDASMQELCTLEEECEEAADFCLNQLDAWQQQHQEKHGHDPPDLAALMSLVEESLPTPRDATPTFEVVAALVHATESKLIALCDLGDRIDSEVKALRG
eukprot:TRINITY_DN22705_c0_g1_i1.p1 TRINITY_DN22705_c0_g1~~TRINITY_DN22705_c0_g1_i1.p1  ORF type:complete len:1838 (+),score=319.04 TRINITY_DN22705_c0_g1_i1:652-5514(+)